MKGINKIAKWIFLTGIVTLTACQPKVEEFVYPEDLEGQRNLLAEKKTELKDIESMIERLEEDIEMADPSVKNLKKVTTRIIEKQNIERFVQVQGSIVADDYIMASTEVGGRLMAMNIEEGDNIRRGQKIGSIDMESLKKQISEIQTSLDLANEVYNRQERLWKQDIGSEIQYLQAKNNKERLEKSIETIRFNLTKGDVYAPASGVVEKVMLKSGEMAGPGSPILQILNVNKVKVSIDVPEKYLNNVRKGSRFVGENEEGATIATKKYVEIGESVDNQLIITSGLNGDETLIVDGARIVNNGQEILIENKMTDDR